MYAFIVIIHIAASAVLILLILLQAGRGGGLSEGFGGGAMQNIFGSSSKTIMTKITAVCAVVFILTSISLTILVTRRGKSLIDVKKTKVSDIIAQQKTKAAPIKQQAQTPTTEPQAEDAKKTVTVKEVKIDPQTGKEIVVKEEKMTPEEAAARQGGK